MEVSRIIFNSDKLLIEALGNLIARLAGIQEDDESNQTYSDHEAESFHRSRIALQRQQSQDRKQN